MTKHHGTLPLKGLASHCKRGHQPAREDRFGRMFPDLAAGYVPADILAEIGRPKGPMDGGPRARRARTVPVGHVFFGQFVDHDITLDLVSSFDQVAPDGLPNARTPTLDLDCIYGAGPDDAPFMYVKSGTFEDAKLLTGADQDAADPAVANDLLRSVNGRAIIGDHRNDENRIVSQLQASMIRFHNKVCDDLHAADSELEGKALFDAARREVTWHYQWGVVNDFLVSMCGDAVVWDILSSGRKFFCPVVPMIPVEFSVAAYRFGHSMAPMKIQIQATQKAVELFGPELGNGFSAVPSQDALVDWRQLMFVPQRKGVQPAEKLDTKMAGELLDLPFIGAGETSLATRNLMRGNTFLLPGGDKIAQEMGRDPHEIGEVMDRVGELSKGRIREGAPLWLYVLAEGEVIGRESHHGKFDKGEGLGPVGARIVAEVLIGLLEEDPRSYLGANRNWVAKEDYNTIGKMLVAANPSIF